MRVVPTKKRLYSKMRSNIRLSFNSETVGQKSRRKPMPPNLLDTMFGGFMSSVPLKVLCKNTLLRRSRGKTRDPLSPEMVLSHIPFGRAKDAKPPKTVSGRLTILMFTLIFEDHLFKYVPVQIFLSIDLGQLLNVTRNSESNFLKLPPTKSQGKRTWGQI